MIWIGRFAAGGREGQQGRFLDQAAQAESGLAQEQVADAEQDGPQQRQAQVELADQLAVADQHAQALVVMGAQRR